MPITFGFEAEFSSNVDELAAALARESLCGASRRHSYHCDCSNCSVGPGRYPFRAQNDSSCAGEIISNVFEATPDGWPEAVGLMQDLQRHALDVDAGINGRTGFHVHVGEYDTDMIGEGGQVVRSWLAVEHVMRDVIAAGVFTSTRTFNAPVWGIVREYDWDGDVRSAISRTAEMDYDRHADLASTDSGFYEFRVFNGTRVSWRMEMACRTAVALSSESVTEQFALLLDDWLVEHPDEWHSFRHSSRRGIALAVATPDEVMAVLGEHDRRLAALLRKQVSYLERRRQGTPLAAISNQTYIPDRQEVLADVAMADTGFDLVDA